MKRARRAPTRFDLYEWCVQAPEMQARFLRALHAGRPRVLVEDFCGPASIARAWALLDPRLTSAGIDVDPEPLAHAALRAKEQGIPPARFRAVRSDVLRVTRRADMIAAFNFAVCEIHKRDRLIAYLRRVARRLRPRGAFACDLYAGRDAFTTSSTTRRIRTAHGTVGYTWQQRAADPLTAIVENAIHFRLPNGRTIRNAFEYRWRLWSIAELREAMHEAGFASTEVHLSYGEAIDGEGNPIPIAAQPGDLPDDNFVAYVIGRVP